jgi:uncharacterized protein (DUF488 family)
MILTIMETARYQKQKETPDEATSALQPLFSVGHSNHDFTHLLSLLRQAGIQLIADVRSSPYSQWLPHYNRENLEQLLRDNGIEYRYFGDELGGRPRDQRLYDEANRVDYERVRRTSAFQEGISGLCRMLQKQRIAMLCSEEDPLDCHRGLMIAPALVQRGIMPIHLRGDGSLEPTEELEARLLAETKVGSGILDGLFAATLSTEDRRELVAEAYRAQARRKAFRLSEG